MVQNFYSILEVSPDATRDQIKSQYRKLVREVHPDQYLDIDKKLYYEEKLKKINEAYKEVIQQSRSSHLKMDAKSNDTRPYISMFLGGASLSIFIFFIIILLHSSIPTRAMSSIESASMISTQKFFIQENKKQNQSPPAPTRSTHTTSDTIPKAMPANGPGTFVHTSKLGTNIHPVNPLQLKIVDRTYK